MELAPEGAEKIAEALKENRSVTTIDLGGNNIHTNRVNAFAQVSKDNTVITVIGPKGVGFIADTLKYNTTISTLDLRANGLDARGAVCPARSMKVVDEALTLLDLAFNEIRDTGALAIAQALKANEDVAVTSLNLASNFITKFGQSALTDARDHVYEMNRTEINIFF